MNYKKELDDMVFSFSRISSYYQCPYQFYCHYIENKIGDDNWWAANGRAVHETLEAYYKNDINIEETPQLYLEKFDDIYETCSESVKDKTFVACMEYFTDCDISIPNDYEILGVEKECNFVIEGHKFVGYIDLLLRNKKTGQIIIQDHKSSTYPLGKTGKVLKAHEESYESYKRQLYLYSNAIIKEYNTENIVLRWNYFKEHKILDIDFNKEDYEKSIKWAIETINKIYDDDTFVDNQNYFYCNNLCEFRNDCLYKMMKEED